MEQFAAAVDTAVAFVAVAASTVVDTAVAFVGATASTVVVAAPMAVADAGSIRH